MSKKAKIIDAFCRAEGSPDLAGVGEELDAIWNSATRAASHKDVFDDLHGALREYAPEVAHVIDRDLDDDGGTQELRAAAEIARLVSGAGGRERFVVIGEMARRLVPDRLRVVR